MIRYVRITKIIGQNSGEKVVVFPKSKLSDGAWMMTSTNYGWLVVAQPQNPPPQR